ncbi:MAG: BldC family transcriptional regulator [Actinobacteria bacterium]|nr:BldC family transcriptional regulator [Actinomycetota bacterium]
MRYTGNDNDELLTPAEVAKRFGVNPKTITRWADAGKLTAIRTLGGHRRYRESEIDALIEQHAEPRQERGRDQHPFRTRRGPRP